MTGAFDGLRVLDASSGPAGAAAAMHFGDHGADVVRVLPPGVQSVDLGPGFLCWDRNKSLVALDRGNPELQRLIAAADLLVLDQSRAEVQRDGLDPVALDISHPRLVHLWLPMLNPIAPWGDLPADPLLADAVGSASGEHGSYDGGPLALVTPIPSRVQALLGATAAAAALLERQRSGQGQGVLVSGLHATMALQGATMTDAPGILRFSQSGGGSAPSFRLYECADGQWIYLAALTEPMFITALEVLDLYEVLTYPGVEGQLMNTLKPGVGEPVLARMQARFRDKPRAEWERLLTAADVANAPTQDRAAWWHGEVVASNGMRQVREHPALGSVELPGEPLRLSRTPGSFSHLPSPAAFIDPAKVWTEQRPTSPPDPAWDPGGGPLAGLRVLDLGSFVAGPFAATLLSDYGADVVKVEGPDGDPYRATAISFLVFHRDQSDVVLDIKQPAGREVLTRLVREADVLLDNVRPGARERIGTDWATLREINPRLVRGTVTAWGPDNALSDTPAFDPLFQARSGLLSAQGGDAAPCQSAMLVHDIGTGALLAFGLLAGLHARARDGLGQEVVTTMANTAVMLQAGELTSYAGRPAPARGGHDHVGDGAVHRLHACADGWVAVAATSHSHAEGARRALGLRPGAETLLSAPAHGQVADQVAAALSGRSVADVVAALASEGVPAAPVLPRGGFLADPWIAAGRMLSPIEDPVFGTCTLVRTFAEWTRSQHEFTATAVPPGADTRRELARVGFNAEEIEALIAGRAAISA